MLYGIIKPILLTRLYDKTVEFRYPFISLDKTMRQILHGCLSFSNVCGRW